MDYDTFKAAHAANRIVVEIDPVRAARFVSARMLLPLVALPVLGIGVALALIGWIKTGLAVLAVGIIVPRLVKRGAVRFVLHEALRDRGFYMDAVREDVLRIRRPGDT